MQKAFRIITQHRLLSRAELACSSLVLAEATETVATVALREKHGGKFGGATETALRRFTNEINLTTGGGRGNTRLNQARRVAAQTENRRKNTFSLMSSRRRR
jgi:hypothetical protein